MIVLAEPVPGASRVYPGRLQFSSRRPDKPGRSPRLTISDLVYIMRYELTKGSLPIAHGFAATAGVSAAQNTSGETLGLVILMATVEICREHAAHVWSLRQIR